MPPERPPVRWLCALLCAAPLVAAAAPASVDAGGHVKARFIARHFPEGSLFRGTDGAAVVDTAADLRLNLGAARGAWSLRAAWQLVARRDESRATRLPLPGDERRLFDLSRTVTDDGRFAALHRIDRLWLGHTTEKTVLRIGRQALTWGNGLFFSVLDIVNPFDPAAVDTEYKAGDDMLYAQYLRDNGHDVEAALVLRRDPLSGGAESSQATAAVRYNGLAGNGDYQLLAARSYGATVLGIGGNRSIGGAVWRADLALSDAAGWTAEILTNLSYSWRWQARNVLGALEYYFNGHGLADGRYEAVVLGTAGELTARLARGQTHTIGRHYLGAGATVELSPLLLVTPNLFWNLDDGSALAQLVLQYSLGDNLSLLAAADLPLGPDGSEYGGLEAPAPGRFLSVGAALFVQLAWYF